jgi:hypothetical protein
VNKLKGVFVESGELKYIFILKAKLDFWLRVNPFIVGVHVPSGGGFKEYIMQTAAKSYHYRSVKVSDCRPP